MASDAPNVMNGRTTLTLTVGVDTSDDEAALLVAAFDGFDVTVERKALRLSQAALPLLVSFAVGVLSNAGWDLLKSAMLKVRSARSSRRVTRKVVIEVETRRRQFVIADNQFVIREGTDERVCTTFEELFEEMRRD